MRLREGKKPITDIYSLHIYNTELVKFQLVVEQLARDAAKVLYVNESMKYLLPSDMYLRGRHPKVVKKARYTEEVRFLTRDLKDGRLKP